MSLPILDVGIANAYYDASLSDFAFETRNFSLTPEFEGDETTGPTMYHDIIIYDDLRLFTAVIRLVRPL